MKTGRETSRRSSMSASHNTYDSKNLMIYDGDTQAAFPTDFQTRPSTSGPYKAQ